MDLFDDLKEFMMTCDQPVVIYDVKDGGYHVNYFNISGERMENVKFSDVEGKRLDILIPGILKTKLFNVFDRVYKTGETEECEIQYDRGDKIVKRKNLVKKLSNGKLIVRYSEYTISDILDKYLKNLDNSPSGMFLMDNNGEFIYANKVFLSLINKEKVEDIKNCGIFNRDIRDYINEMEGDIRIEKTVKETNKELIINMLRLDDDEIIGYCTDITELKSYSKSMKKTCAELEESRRKIEKSDNLKSSFLANISHEIRTPLNSIVGFSRLLLKVGRSERRKYVSIIERNADMLLGLIDDIIDLSKIEAKEVKLRTDKCSLLSIVEDIKFSYINKSVNVKIILEDNIPNVIIYTDEYRLKQILNNLVGNAIKFTNKGYVKIGYCIKEGNILFNIEDTGNGIPEEDKDYIFERFTQLNEKDSKKYGGTGLGLSISKKVVELLGGKIWFESIVGKGTTFYFTIPSDYVQKIANEYNSIHKYVKRKINWKNKNILIVEDEEYSSMLLTKILENTGSKYIVVRYGIDALKLIKKENFDLVLVDMKLPDMDGVDLVERIKRKIKIPIISQSESDNKQPGFDDYIIKPIEAHKLIKTLNKYLK